VLAGWVSELGRFTATWGEDGYVIDPDGLHATDPPTAPASGAATTETASEDGGFTIDPNG
jgi:hypothetical protein